MGPDARRAAPHCPGGHDPSAGTAARQPVYPEHAVLQGSPQHHLPLCAESAVQERGRRVTMLLWLCLAGPGLMPHVTQLLFGFQFGHRVTCGSAVSAERAPDI